MTASILHNFKPGCLQAMKAAGLFGLVKDSRWRQQRLLILCYHGISLEDEHEWNPPLFMSPAVLEQRFELLKRGRYWVLPLAEAVQRLYRNDLPPRSVVLTFDDGNYDFYKQAYPLLKSYGFPATVYQTTYYADFQLPIFRLICSYMLWTRRGSVINANGIDGLSFPLDLQTEAARKAVILQLVSIMEKQKLTGQQQDELAAKLANVLGVDYDALVAKRILRLMTPDQIAELSRSGGISFELHTHRHRAPLNHELFRREIQDNRKRLQAIKGGDAVHFCYPSGVCRQEFLPWLVEERVLSATTCHPGLASTKSHPLLLPRFVDTSLQPRIVFESWLVGVGALLARNKRT